MPVPLSTGLEANFDFNQTNRTNRRSDTTLITPYSRREVQDELVAGGIRQHMLAGLSISVGLVGNQTR